MRPSEWIHNRAKEIAAELSVAGRNKLSPIPFYGLATVDYQEYGRKEISCDKCVSLPCKCDE